MDITDKTETARMLHVLADGVACGCVEIMSMSTEHNPLIRYDVANIRIVRRTCMLHDHERDRR